jgi:hypothetical protein
VHAVAPGDAPAPAEAGDAELRGISFPSGFGIDHRGIQVRHHLTVGNEVHHLGEDFLIVGQLCDVALAVVEIDGDREIAELGEPAAHVLDVLVHAEDLLHHQHERQLAALLGHGAVGRNRPGHGLDADFAGGKSRRVGRDRSRGDRLHDLRKSLRQQRRDEVAQAGL